MHYLIDMGDGETYAVCSSGTVRWISDKPLRFSVVAYAGFNDEDVNVYANGKALAPDVGGFYTLQKSDETVMITAAGAVKDDSAPRRKAHLPGVAPPVLQEDRGFLFRRHQKINPVNCSKKRWIFLVRNSQVLRS